MAPRRLRLRTSNCSILLIYLPRKDEKLSWPSWLTYSGRFTHISGHPSAAGGAQDRESSQVKDRRSIPLYHATNQTISPFVVVWLYIISQNVNNRRQRKAAAQAVTLPRSVGPSTIDVTRLVVFGFVQRTGR